MFYVAYFVTLTIEKTRLPKRMPEKIKVMEMCREVLKEIMAIL
jgi:hypothetical protein